MPRSSRGPVVRQFPAVRRVGWHVAADRRCSRPSVLRSAPWPGHLGFVLIAAVSSRCSRSRGRSSRRSTRSTGGSRRSSARATPAYVTSPGRAHHRLVAHPVRGRHARHDHRRPRRDGHRFPAQGGPGLGCVGIQGPHRRLRLEHDRPRPHRRAQGRRLPAEGRRPRRPREEPGRAGVYFVRGDATNEEDLERAGIEEASAALVFPADASDDADMRSILTIMAIEHVAPGVRTVAEVNNPRHEPHFRRADVDELLVTSKVASHLLARSALYPGLTGHRDRHRVRRRGLRAVPDHPARRVHAACRSTRSRRGCARSTGRRCCRSTAAGTRSSTRATDFILQPGDDAIVVAESLGTLAPLEIADVNAVPQTAAVVPSAPKASAAGLGRRAASACVCGPSAAPQFLVRSSPQSIRRALAA